MERAEGGEDAPFHGTTKIHHANTANTLMLHKKTKQKTSRETDRRTGKQAVRTFGNLIFLRGDTITRRKFIYADPSVKRAVTDTVLETRWGDGGKSYLCIAASSRFVFSQFR